MAIDIARYQRSVGTDMDVEFYIEDVYCTRHGVLRCSRPVRYMKFEVEQEDDKSLHYITIIGVLYPFEREGAILKLKLEQTSYPRIEIRMKLLQIGSNRYKVLKEYVANQEECKSYIIKRIAFSYKRKDRMIYVN